MTPAQLAALEVVTSIAHQHVATQSFLADRPPASRQHRDWIEARDAVQLLQELLAEHGLWFRS